MIFACQATTYARFTSESDLKRACNAGGGHKDENRNVVIIANCITQCSRVKKTVDKSTRFVFGCSLIREHKKQQTSNEGGWVFRSGRGNWGWLGALPTATSRATNPRQHRPKDLSILQHDIHLIEIKHCEDTRPQKQLSATGNSIKASAPSTKEPPLPSTPSFGSEWHHPQQSLGCGVLPGVVAALSVASLWGASPTCLLVNYALCCTSFWCFPTPLPLAWFPCPSVCVEVAFFFLTLGRVGCIPLLYLRPGSSCYLCSFSKLSSQRVPVRLFFQLGLGSAL